MKTFKLGFVLLLATLISAINTHDIDTVNISDEDLKLDEELEFQEHYNNPVHSKNTYNHKPRGFDTDDEFDIPEDMNIDSIPDHLKRGPHHSNTKNTRRPPHMDPRHEGMMMSSNRYPHDHLDGPGHIPRDFSTPPQGQPTENSAPTEEEKQRMNLIRQIELILELISLLIFSVFLLNYLFGKIQSYNVLERWNSTTKDFFVKNYAHVGFSEEPQYDMPFMKESNFEFKFYASGRKNVNGFLANFYLKKRYNLFHRFFGEDVVKFQLSTDYQTPFVMCLCDKKQQKIIKKNQLDISFFTEYYPDEVENDYLGLHTEDLSIYRTIFKDQNFKGKVKEILPYIQWLHISDRKHLNKFETNIVVIFKMTSNKDLWSSQIDFIHELVERIKNVKITNQVG